MSLDLYTRCEHGYGPDGYDLNITHNVRGICEAAGCDPWEWHGLTIAEVIPSLDAAIEALASNPEAFEHLAPSNGWGSVAGTERFLRRVRAHALEVRDETHLRWWVSR